MDNNKYFEKMSKLAPSVFIDPLSDLGSFNYRLLKFEEPVSSLTNKFSGDPYAKKWWPIIEEMRSIFIEWQKEVQSHLDGSAERTGYIVDENQITEQKELIEALIRLGFSMKFVAQHVGYSEKTIRNKGFRRSDLNKRTQRQVYYRSSLPKIPAYTDLAHSVS